MNLTPIFETQKILDQRIIEEHGLQGQNLLHEKILALLVELGECANEWRGFKFWSKDQKPRTKRKLGCHACQGLGEFHHEAEVCLYCDGTGWEVDKNPLLEEYVDCIHFFVGAAINLNIEPGNFVVEGDYTQPTATLTFNRVFSTVSSIDVLLDPETPYSINLEDIQDTLHEAFSCFVGLAEKHLGFTWEQIEGAYFEKNKINHIRQNAGY